MSKDDPHRVKTVMQELDGGRIVRRLQSEIEIVVDEVSSRLGQKASGSVTLKIDITRENEEHVRLTPSISKTLPKKPLSPSLFFFGEAGTMHKRDPYQVDAEDVIDIETAKTKGE